MITIRPAEERDLPALLDIYNHYVIHTPITFDIEPRTLDQRREWFAQFAPAGKYRCLVADDAGRAIGWASSAKFKDRAAYDTSIETSVYCAPDLHRRGIGRTLYTKLFEVLQGEDIHRAFGGITLPNAGSVGLHEAMGFRHIGSYTEIGRKFGKYWNVGLYLRDMSLSLEPVL